MANNTAKNPTHDIHVYKQTRQDHTVNYLDKVKQVNTALENRNQESIVPNDYTSQLDLIYRGEKALTAREGLPDASPQELRLNMLQRLKTADKNLSDGEAERIVDAYLENRTLARSTLKANFSLMTIWKFDLQVEAGFPWHHWRKKFLNGSNPVARLSS